MLDCNPLAVNIILQCITSSSADNVTWYWTQHVGEAGVSGTAILEGDTSKNYEVATIGTNQKQLGFTVDNSTLGYYWCEISNAVNVSLRPSTITPVCPSMNSSHQNICTLDHIRDNLHHEPDECAEASSPTEISRHPLSTSCAMLPILVSGCYVFAFVTSVGMHGFYA